MFPLPEVFGEAVGEQLPTGPAEQGNSRTKKGQKTASRLPPELPPRAKDVDPVALRPVVAGPTHSTFTSLRRRHSTFTSLQGLKRYGTG